MPVGKNRYLYMYGSNKTGYDALFDNLPAGDCVMSKERELKKKLQFGQADIIGRIKTSYRFKERNFFECLFSQVKRSAHS